MIFIHTVHDASITTLCPQQNRIRLYTLTITYKAFHDMFPTYLILFFTRLRSFHFILVMLNYSQSLWMCLSTDAGGFFVWLVFFVFFFFPLECCGLDFRSRDIHSFGGETCKNKTGPMVGEVLGYQAKHQDRNSGREIGWNPSHQSRHQESH